MNERAVNVSQTQTPITHKSDVTPQGTLNNHSTENPTTEQTKPMAKGATEWFNDFFGPVKAFFQSLFERLSSNEDTAIPRTKIQSEKPNFHPLGNLLQVPMNAEAALTNLVNLVLENIDILDEKASFTDTENIEFCNKMGFQLIQNAQGEGALDIDNSNISYTSQELATLAKPFRDSIRSNFFDNLVENLSIEDKHTIATNLQQLRDQGIENAFRQAIADNTGDIFKQSVLTNALNFFNSIDRKLQGAKVPSSTTKPLISQIQNSVLPNILSNISRHHGAFTPALSLAFFQNISNQQAQELESDDAKPHQDMIIAKRLWVDLGRCDIELLDENGNSVLIDQQSLADFINNKALAELKKTPTKTELENKIREIKEQAENEWKMEQVLNMQKFFGYVENGNPIANQTANDKLYKISIYMGQILPGSMSTLFEHPDYPQKMNGTPFFIDARKSNLKRTYTLSKNNQNDITLKYQEKGPIGAININHAEERVPYKETDKKTSYIDQGFGIILSKDNILKEYKDSYYNDIIVISEQQSEQ